MPRINTQYLDTALGKTEESVSTFLRSAEVEQNRIEAESKSIERLGLGKANFWSSVGTGTKYGIILLAAGTFLVLAGIGLKYVVDAWKRPYGVVSIASVLPIQEKILEVQNSSTKLQNELTKSQLSTAVQLDGLLLEIKALKLLMEKEDTQLSHSSTSKEPTTETKIILSRLEAQILAINDKLDRPNSIIAPPEVEAIPRKVLKENSFYFVKKNSESKECPANKSYKNVCKGKYTFNDGSIYNGLWKSGRPEGKGQLTLPDGSTMNGSWKQGRPVSLDKEKTSTIKPMKSVVYFNNIPGSFISAKFRQIVAGHRFKSSNQKMWDTAFCYLTVDKKKFTKLSVDLADYFSPNSEVVNLPYKPALKEFITKEEFETAQSACPFTRVGFK